MTLTHFFVILSSCLFVIVCVQIAVLLNEKKRLAQISNTLDIVLNGDYDKRILVPRNDMTAEVCYKVNEIAMQYKETLIQAEKTKSAHKQLMTSFSHDIRTPLTTLIGYLDAIQTHVVLGEEREQYIYIAQSKAYNLKSYIDAIFELFKLYSREKIFSFERTDINELTRNIVIDWIPQLEQGNFAYDIKIAESEMFVETDISAYTRIVNNLIQNAIQHSAGRFIYTEKHGID
jgi:Signal transduction histidine kinase